MIVLICMILGFALGWFRARRAGGNSKDRLQWALAHMLALMIVGLLVTVFFVPAFSFRVRLIFTDFDLRQILQACPQL